MVGQPCSKGLGISSTQILRNKEIQKTGQEAAIGVLGRNRNWVFSLPNSGAEENPCNTCRWQLPTKHPQAPLPKMKQQGCAMGRGHGVSQHVGAALLTWGEGQWPSLYPSTFQARQFLSLINTHHVYIAGRALKLPQSLGLKLSHDHGLIPMKTKYFLLN